MILLVNPCATKAKNRRFPLSIMSVGAALPKEIAWEIVDENIPGVDAAQRIAEWIEARARTADPVTLMALSVMPGPQLVSAVRISKAVKRAYPRIPIVWGGNFGSLYPAPVLNSSYVDWVVRGQGEQTLIDLLGVLAGIVDPKSVAGLAFREADGTHWIGPERTWIGPDELPAPPYHKIDVAQYLHPTFLGRRSGVYQASIGCPYACSFCGVVSVYGRKEKVQRPERTAQHLDWLARYHGMDSVHFYDNNFFLNDAHAREIAEAFRPLGLKWWCEARVDAVLRFSDTTWRMLKEAGMTMVFFGAESGSNEVLAKMNKGITIEQTAEVARLTRHYGVIPEFSFVMGDPDQPEREIENTLAFIRRLKQINPHSEIIRYFYTPTPQRGGTYGNIDPLAGTPLDLDEWVSPEWVGWMTHENPHLPWLDESLKQRVDDFELVLQSRFPSVNDRSTRPWGKLLGQVLARRRWEDENYARPAMLRQLRRLARNSPVDRQAYGHLREPGLASALT
ncbi:MAG: B12-binding domain-containing radical SAM protein [Porphyrobacter sp.]|nr:B12-binding domain-containing radical SAM protein [Porphyrobacter sp.]